MTVGDSATSSTRHSGWLLRGSDIVAGVVTRRFGVLENDQFATYRNQQDNKPSSVWPLHPKCDITRLEERELTIRDKGKSTMFALMAGKYEKVQGYTFTVAWPQNAGGKTSKVLLGFQAETEAARWQTAFLLSVTRLGTATVEEPEMPEFPSADSVASNTDQSNNSHVTRELPMHMDLSITSTDPVVRDGSNEQTTPTVQWKQMQDMRSVSSSGCTTSSSTLGPEPPAAQGASGLWSPWKHVNGVAVYREEEDNNDGSGGAFMVSTIIRSPPSICFDALMETTRQPTTVSGLLKMELLERLDENSQILHTQIEGIGAFSRLLAPRYIVVQRTWRQEEEDGTYVVLLHSVDRPLATDQREEMPSLWGWLRAPVRAQVSAAGFTIAPLKEKYLHGKGESPESLVTMVLKMDFGGICSQNNLLHPVSELLGLQHAWIESILMTVMRLRDTVEQARFVTLPFTASGSVPRGGATRRTTTALIKESQLPSPVKSYDVRAIAASNESVSEPAAARLPSSSGTMDPKYWSRPGAAGFKVRGTNYLKDRKKVLADEPMFDLVSVDLVKLDRPTPHIARYLRSIKCSSAAFTYVVQIMVPGPPHLALVMGWGAETEALHGFGGNNSSIDANTDSNDTETEPELTPSGLALMRFVTGTDEHRNGVFKLIPKIVKGSWIVRQSVGSTPVLLGRKLKQYYFSGRGTSGRYFEVDIDVGSSYTAASVVGLVSGATKSLVVDLAVLSEGKRPEELPEALIGTVRFQNLDLGTAVPLDTSREVVPPETVLSGNEDQKSRTKTGI